MKVNICGIHHGVVECEDNFNIEAHFGQIDYQKCEIRINEELPFQAKNETICHEMLHGMLVHLGYNEQSEDEQFVSALANAINQGFTIKDCSLPEHMVGPKPPKHCNFKCIDEQEKYMTLCAHEEDDDE